MAELMIFDLILMLMKADSADRADDTDSTDSTDSTDNSSYFQPAYTDFLDYISGLLHFPDTDIT